MTSPMQSTIARSAPFPDQSGASGDGINSLLRAAAILEKEGMDVEVVDPRTLAPLDREIICDSAFKAKRFIVADQAWRSSRQPKRNCFKSIPLLYRARWNWFPALWKSTKTPIHDRAHHPKLAPAGERTQ
jgi:hypothetical protein